MLSKKNLSICFLALLSLAGMLSAARADGYSKSFRLPAESVRLEVVNKMGSISVNVAEGNTLSISAKQADAPVSATQSAQGNVKVEVTGNATVDLTINVPVNTALDLTCIMGEISVRNVGGPVRAITTEGNILVSGVRTAKVEASSKTGDVTFSGDILAGGNYLLKSFSGRVSATLPAAASYTLSASSNQGGIDVGGMSFAKQTDRQVEGANGNGDVAARTTVKLWTQEGTIQLRRR
ncbi:MAG: DUF4097 family beta strand repeat-containing protein [Blastocatellia bacterium]